MFTVLICSFLAVACVASNSYGPSSEDRSRPRNVGGSTDTIVVARDAYLGPDGDDYWKGTTDSLVVDGVRSTRILIQVDQAAIEAALGNGTLANATLELTVQSTGAGWPTGGATVDAYRVLQHWTEAEVTWVCSDGHIGWDMSTGAGTIWHTAQTARTTITNGQTSVVRLDVTADVAAFFAGTQPNHGWLIKRTGEGAAEPGRISFSSREGAPQPRLVLQITSDTTRPIMPDSVALPTPPVTVARPGSPGAGVLYYRDVIGIRFDDSTSGTTVRAVLAEYNATIIGGLPWVGEYIVRTPDPGATWAAYDSLRLQIQQEQGVEYVAGVTYRSVFKIKGRYPSDGSGLQRSDWFSPAPGAPARPLVAIRAPLAWGCETGIYGQQQVKVGVLDLQFDLQHPDLAPNTLLLTQPPVNRLHPQVLLAPDEVNHGTAVAGVMTAAGDNQTAATGVLWRSHLHAFAVARNNQFVQDPTLFASEVLFPLAATSGVRVLVNSLDFGDIDSTSVLRLKRALRRYIDYQDGNLFVMAADEGASPRRSSFAAALLGPGSTSLGLERAFAELFATSARQRLLIISATDNNDQLAFFSDHYPDATELVAPGVDVLTLTAGGGIAPDTGTSYAAPLVGGAAGLLLAMAPGLQGSEIKDYLVRGAAEPRVDPVTGAIVPAPSIGVAQGRLLDAYGSLTLLSRERPGTPICGLDLQMEMTPSGNRLRVGRNSPEYLTPAADESWARTFSVAQGGRRIALDGNFNAPIGLATVVRELQGGTWSRVATVQGVDRVLFLEQDTAYLRTLSTTAGSASRIDLEVAIGSAVPARRLAATNVTATLPAGSSFSGYFTGGAPMSPTGDWIYLDWDWSDQCPSGAIDAAFGGGSYLVQLRGSGTTPSFSTYNGSNSCGGGGTVGAPEEQYGYVGWRNTGNELYRSVNVISSSGSLFARVRQYSIGAGLAAVGTETQVSGRWFDALSWGPEGGRLLSAERRIDISPFVCYHVTRRGSSATVIAEATAAVPSASDCGFVAPATAPAMRSPSSLASRLRANGDAVAATPSAAAAWDARLRERAGSRHGGAFLRAN